ncbi:integrase arm-type DNA-binding domain-containing protein [uncultured Roseibium sp.]|uniref:tyrosine-type recombinase/integrase n=1 Tax=uncultured Roseibium sp. TaxID=1936171 RepID=UPI0032173415
MAKRITDAALRKADPGTKFYEDSMTFEAKDGGRGYFRLNYRFHGKRKTLSLGIYPTVSLSDARRKRDDAKRLLADGVDPSAERKVQRDMGRQNAANTFAGLSKEYLEHLSNTAIAGGTRKRGKRTLDKADQLTAHAAKTLNRMPLVEIKPLTILENVLRPLEAKGKLETARRTRAFLERMFDYAVITGRIDANPASPLKNAIAAPVSTPRPAITDPAEVGALVRAIRNYGGNRETAIGLELLMLTALRPGELRQSEWSFISGDIWTIPTELTKMRRDHRVPLSRQAIALLDELREYTGRGCSGYLFPAVTSTKRPMSENTLNGALARLGYSKDQVVSHGMRSTFSTICHESGDWRSEVVEASLAHVDGSIKGIYQRSDFMRERAELMQWYADKLDTLASA